MLREHTFHSCCYTSVKHTVPLPFSRICSEEWCVSGRLQPPRPKLKLFTSQMFIIKFIRHGAYPNKKNRYGSSCFSNKGKRHSTVWKSSLRRTIKWEQVGERERGKALSDPDVLWAGLSAFSAFSFFSSSCVKKTSLCSILLCAYLSLSFYFFSFLCYTQPRFLFLSRSRVGDHADGISPGQEEAQMEQAHLQ